MTVLGAVLAGGQSLRFGTDKAQAVLNGKPLVDHAVAALAAQCDAVIIVGPHPTGIPDWPSPGMGPLGGVAAALHFAADAGHAEVLTCGVDSVGLPPELLETLSPAPAYIISQPVIGLWPVSAISALEHMLTYERRHSMRAFVEAIAARGVHLSVDPANINTPADLAALEPSHGL
jgi:molybdenum cofactor guanylyltransferase